MLIDNNPIRGGNGHTAPTQPIHATSDVDMNGGRPEMRMPRVAWPVAVVVSLVGILLITASRWATTSTDYNSFAEWLDEVGKVILTTGTVAFLYECFARVRFFNATQEAINIQLQPLREEESKLRTSIVLLQNTVAIAQGAVESGITGVYAKREEALADLGDLLDRAPDGTEVCLSGISLGDFLCPHGKLYGTLRDLLDGIKSGKRSLRLRLLLLDQDCTEARIRARREEPARFRPGSKGYEHTKCYRELATASDGAEDYAAEYSPGNGEERGFLYNTYALAPVCFVGIVGNDMFVENYHYAGRGGESPVIRMSKNKPGTSGETSRLFSIYNDHFESLWGDPTPGDAQHPVGSPIEVVVSPGANLS